MAEATAICATDKMALTSRFKEARKIASLEGEAVDLGRGLNMVGVGLGRRAGIGVLVGSGFGRRVGVAVGRGLGVGVGVLVGVGAGL